MLPSIARTKLISTKAKEGYLVSRPVFHVDFNEMIAEDVVLLSAGDHKKDTTGETMQLHEGLLVSVYMPDLDQYGKEDYLLADGVAVRNSSSGWATHVKWCCQVDENGIQARSIKWPRTQ